MTLMEHGRYFAACGERDGQSSCVAPVGLGPTAFLEWKGSPTPYLIGFSVKPARVSEWGIWPVLRPGRGIFFLRQSIEPMAGAEPKRSSLGRRYPHVLGRVICPPPPARTISPL